MALFTLILVTLVSTVAVKVGTVALMMTGVDRRKAAFQALSAFTNAGWTTRETEVLMAHDQRRRIVMVLLVLGHAGLASVIATLISSLGQRGAMEVFGKVALLAGAILVIYLMARWRGLDRRLMAEIEKRLKQTTDLRVASFEEVLLMAEGYGVVEVYVSETADIAHKSIGQSRLRARGMAVLAVDRAGQIIPAPDADTVLLPGDRLICYGVVKAIGGIADEQAIEQIDGGALLDAQTGGDLERGVPRIKHPLGYGIGRAGIEVGDGYLDGAVSARLPAIGQQKAGATSQPAEQIESKEYETRR